ncbi:hypothetical protein ACU8KH_04190 [Lachancea thermotolerans]
MVSSGIEPLIPALLARCLNQLGQETNLMRDSKDITENQKSKLSSGKKHDNMEQEIHSKIFYHQGQSHWLLFIVQSLMIRHNDPTQAISSYL